jgi:hypothetical protein
VYKQIKRTRLRLVAYIQRLSRAAYLPNRYTAPRKPEMSTQKRKILAVATGTIFILAGIFVGFFGQFIAASVGDALVNRGALPGLTVPYASGFYSYVVLVFLFASGLSVTIMLWEPRASYKRRVSIYSILLLVALSISVFNYAHADFLINYSAQALLNFVLIFFAAVVLVELIKLKPKEKDLLVLKIIAVFFLGLTGVFLPALFSFVWLLYTLGVLTVTQAAAIQLPTLATVASIASAVVSYLTYRRGAMKE